MAVTITEAVAVVPTMMITGLTGATVGAAATVSDLHAQTAVVATHATTPVTVAAVTPVTITEAVAVAAVTLAETTITAAVTDAV